VNYLSNHLAGSEVALEMLCHLEQAYAGSPPARLTVELRAEIEADQRELKDLMARRQIPQSRPRQAAAWLAERLSELKLRIDDPSAGAR
jgi:hypothetical protein